MRRKRTAWNGGREQIPRYKRAKGQGGEQPEKGGKQRALKVKNYGEKNLKDSLTNPKK